MICPGFRAPCKLALSCKPLVVPRSVLVLLAARVDGICTQTELKLNVGSLQNTWPVYNSRTWGDQGFQRVSSNALAITERTELNKSLCIHWIGTRGTFFMPFTSNRHVRYTSNQSGIIFYLLFTVLKSCARSKALRNQAQQGHRWFRHSFICLQLH